MPFELQPVLKGSLLELRPLRPEDFDVLYAVARDPLIWEQHPNNDRYKEDVFREFFRGALESGGAFLVVDGKDGHVIGSSRYHGLDEEKGEVEIGWTFLARSHWGGVYNREMKDLMLRHAFRFVKSVVFVVGDRNFRSQKAVEKIGGVREGTRPDGRGGVSVVFRIRRVPMTARTFTQRIEAPPARVFPLLCPVREGEWLEGWSAELLRSESGYAELGCVFRTAPPGEPETIWIVSRHEPDAGRVDFARVTAGSVATRLSIQVLPSGDDGSAVEITYEFTPTSPEGERVVAERHSEAAFRRSMEWWERSMNHFLATGTKLSKTDGA